MKLDLKTLLIIGLTFVVIVFIMRSCSDKGAQREAERDNQHKMEVAILKAEKTSIQAYQDSLIKTVVIRTRKDSVQLAAQDVRIKALQTKLANQRPTVIEKISADSAVLSYVNTLEEVVSELQTQNDTLKTSLAFHQKVNNDLVKLEIDEDKIHNAMVESFTSRIDQLKKSNRKKERAKRATKVALIIGTFAAFFAGSAWL